MAVFLGRAISFEIKKTALGGRRAAVLHGGFKLNKALEGWPYLNLTASRKGEGGDWLLIIY